MKQITITIPDDCELKQDGNTYTIVEREKKLTYNDVAKELFEDNQMVWYIDYYTNKRQLEKLLAINKLMNVAIHCKVHISIPCLHFVLIINLN